MEQNKNAIGWVGINDAIAILILTDKTLKLK